MGSKILFVDDDQEISKHVSQILTSLGHEITVASNGNEAWQMIRSYEDQYALVITDIKMPGMSGTELLKRISDAHIDVPVAMITGHGDMQTAIDALKHQAFDFIPKPFGSRELRKVIAKAEALASDNHVTFSDWPYTADSLDMTIKAIPDIEKIVTRRIHNHFRAALKYHSVISRSLMAPIQAAVLNARKHGCRDADATIRVTVSYDPDGITVVVKDPGPGFDHKVKTENLYSDSSVQYAGLFLITTSMDEVKWNREGNEITMRRNFKRGGTDGLRL